MSQHQPPARPITAHKGGRTARIPSGRIRPEVLRDLKELLEARGQSFADWVEETVSRSIARTRSK